MNWDAAELLGHAYYAARGFRILVKLVHTSSYDFVIEKDGKFQSVNVKVAGQVTKDKPTSSTRISCAGGVSAKRSAPPDLFLVWLKAQEKFLELPGDFLNGCRTRAIPKALLQNAQSM